MGLARNLGLSEHTQKRCQVYEAAWCPCLRLQAAQKQAKHMLALVSAGSSLSRLHV